MPVLHRGGREGGGITDAKGRGLQGVTHRCEIFLRSERFLNEAAQTGIQHVVEPLLMDKSRAKHDADFRAESAQAMESLFAIHQRHAEIEQDQIKTAWTGPE